MTRPIKKKKKKPKKLGRPTKITVSYGTPGLMRAAGPLVQGTIGPSPKTVEGRAAAGLDPLTPVNAYFLVDTGAGRTCIALETAERMGLKPIDQKPIQGATGTKIANVYSATVILAAHGDGKETVGTNFFQFHLPVYGVPGLENSLDKLNVASTNRQVKIIGLLGRDILSYARMVYDGPGGWASLKFDETKLDATYVATNS